MGRRLPTAEAAQLAPAIRATPNPFRAEIALSGSPHRLVEIFDLAGRRVRGLELDGSGHGGWDGRQDDGMPTSAGLYFLHVPGAPAVRVVRLP
jgi:hypothetical protein